jgi:hypothetical protein
LRTPKPVPLKPGRVYRTADLARWGRNATRLARRLESDGRLRQLAHGLYVCEARSPFGPVPPTDEAVLGAFLNRSPYVISGPSRWNRLGLGSTAMFADTWVYNTRRTCTLKVGSRRLHLRRVRFPRRPTPEWYAIDLLLHHRAVGMSLDDLEGALRSALSAGRFDPHLLREAAGEYGIQSTRDLVDRITEVRGIP